MLIAILVTSGVLLAYANGANDNFKGVATLFGSGTADYRRSLAWATVTTLLGSLAAVMLAGQLLKNFSGKGLVDDSLVANPDFMAAVAVGAGSTVLLATRIGMPISTTHSLVGALVGTGIAAGSSIDLSQLGGTFFLPLLASPLLALCATGSLYPVFRTLRRKLGITTDTCLCVGNQVVETCPATNMTVSLQRANELTVTMGDVVTCEYRYGGQVLGLEAASVLDRSHFLSAGAVSFARGLNDTPKIAALMLVAPQLGGIFGTALVAGAMACGGNFNSRRVAETMSRRITPMNHGQGFTANLMTSLIVIGASRFGMPVSTTHVSCGALFGIGAVTGEAHWRTIGKILLAWITTLPLGATLGAVSLWAISSS
ncbi:MAG: inorganic phosphate transporter [Pirellulales bacterium]